MDGAFWGYGLVPVFIKSARHTAISQAETNDQRVGIQNRLELALRGNPSRVALCLTLYQLIRDYTAYSADAHSLIGNQQAELGKSPQEAGRLQQALFWIYQTTTKTG